jgi:gamma-glutamylcysteine synthetase
MCKLLGDVSQLPRIFNSSLKSQVFVQNYYHIQSFTRSTVMKEPHTAKGKLAETQACEQDFCRHCGRLFHDLQAQSFRPLFRRLT